jgi:hypothetical protein
MHAATRHEYRREKQRGGPCFEYLTSLHIQGMGPSTDASRYAFSAEIGRQKDAFPPKNSPNCGSILKMRALSAN